MPRMVCLRGFVLKTENRGLHVLSDGVVRAGIGRSDADDG